MAMRGGVFRLINTFCPRLAGVNRMAALSFSSVNVAGKQSIKNNADVNPLDDDEDDMEDMFIEGPKGIEWGGPTRGGRRPEPTRYGDWERNGRVSDF